MNYIRRFLFVVFGLDGYLRIIRTAYFPIFKAGLLRRNQVYDWHYFVKNLIRQGDVIIDIGANMGYYSFIFSRLAGNSGKVYSVEPVSPLVRQLKKQLRKQANVCILPFALGNKTGKVFLSMPEEFPEKGYPHHGLFSIRGDHTFTGDQFVFRANQCKGSKVFADADRIDYIKCDVEGYEKIILEDMKPLLIELQPMVQVEIRNENFLQLLNFFKDLNYRAYKLREGNLVELECLPLHQQNYFDTLFVPPRHFGRIRPFMKEYHRNRHSSKPVKQDPTCKPIRLLLTYLLDLQIKFDFTKYPCAVFFFSKKNVMLEFRFTEKVMIVNYEMFKEFEKVFGYDNAKQWMAEKFKDYLNLNVVIKPRIIYSDCDAAAFFKREGKHKKPLHARKFKTPPHLLWR